MATFSNTILMMAGINIIISNGIAYTCTCTFDAGTTQTKSTFLTTSAVNSAWNSKKSSKIATSSTFCCHGVSSLSYFVTGITYLIFLFIR
jgi:hypothetical protein